MKAKSKFMKKVNCLNSEEKFNWDHSRDKRWVTIKDMKEKNLIEEFRKYVRASTSHFLSLSFTVMITLRCFNRVLVCSLC